MAAHEKVSLWLDRIPFLATCVIVIVASAQLYALSVSWQKLRTTVQTAIEERRIVPDKLVMEWIGTDGRTRRVECSRSSHDDTDADWILRAEVRFAEVIAAMEK